MGLSLPHLIILALVVLVLFGRGRISDMMGDFGKGIKSFKEGMAEEPASPPAHPPFAPPGAMAPPAQIVAPPADAPAGTAAPTVTPVRSDPAGPGRN